MFFVSLFFIPYGLYLLIDTLIQFISKQKTQNVNNSGKNKEQFSNEVEVSDHVVGSPILDLEVRLETLSKQLVDSPDTSNLMAAKQELIFKTKQLDLNPPETQKWVKWFINQTEKHEQGTIANHSYLNMIQSYKKFLSDLSV